MHRLTPSPVTGNILSSGSIITSTYPNVPVPDTNYVQHVFRNVHLHMDRVALIDAATGTTFRYSELVNGIRSVASALAKKGLKRGDIVCMYSTNCTDFVFALFGAMSTGATVTLCSTASTPRELQYHLKSSKPSIIFTTKDLSANLKQVAAEVPQIKDIYVMEGQTSDNCLDFRQLLEDNGEADPLGTAPLDAANDVALLPYSSGTTGLPKGVMLTHTNISVNLNQCLVMTPLQKEDVCITTFPLFHISGPTSVIGRTLACGATLVILLKPDFLSILAGVEKYKVKKLFVNPAMCLALLNNEAVNNYDLSSLDVIGCGAAPLDRVVEEALILKLKLTYPNMDFRQGYGMTELSPMCHAVPPLEYRAPNVTGSVGVLVPNEEARVVSLIDSHDLGPNENGHILIRGPNVMKGYFECPQETSDTIDKDGWLSTGDIGYYREDGYFFIVDRLKDMIKVRGLKVAPAELEALLLTHPAVSDCAVIGQKDARSGEIPVAFVMRKSDVTEDELKSFIADQVSEFKRVESVKFVTDLPRNQTGKVLKRLLRDAPNQ